MNADPPNGSGGTAPPHALEFPTATLRLITIHRDVHRCIAMPGHCCKCSIDASKYSVDALKSSIQALKCAVDAFECSIDSHKCSINAFPRYFRAFRRYFCA